MYRLQSLTQVFQESLPGQVASEDELIQELILILDTSDNKEAQIN